MHPVLRQRDLKVWRAVVSIMVKNTTVSHFQLLLLKDVTSHLPIWILSSTEVQIHSLKACSLVYKLTGSHFISASIWNSIHLIGWSKFIFKPRARVLTTKWYRSNQCPLLVLHCATKTHEISGYCSRSEGRMRSKFEIWISCENSIQQNLWIHSTRSTA